jgi:hypothetical protein
MQNLDINILFLIYGSLTDQNILKCVLIFPKLYKKLKKLFCCNLFWKYRVEYFAKKILKDKDYNFDWKSGYYAITETENIFNTSRGPIMELINQCNDSKEALIILIELGYDPSINHNEPIQLSADHGLPNIVGLLLSDHRVNPADNYNYTIIGACRMEYSNNRENYLKVIELLMEDGRVDPSDNNNQALRRALEDGYEDIVQILISDDRVDSSLLDKYR